MQIGKCMFLTVRLGYYGRPLKKFAQVVVYLSIENDSTKGLLKSAYSQFCLLLREAIHVVELALEQVVM